MLRKSLLAFATTFFASNAMALPFLVPSYSPRNDVVEAKIVCLEDGRCYRLPKRPPVAHWVYGNDVFIGPYTGPGYYGPPGSHWRWFPFFGF